MPHSRIPNAVLYGELASGTSKVGRPRLRYKDIIKHKTDKSRLQDWETTALNLETWRSTLHGAADTTLHGAVLSRPVLIIRERRHRTFTVLIIAPLAIFHI